MEQNMLHLSFELSPERKAWRPPTPPERRGEKLVVLDLETSGLKWWEHHRPGGVAYLFPESGRHGYLPWAHVEEPLNIDEDVIYEWFTHEIRDCHILNQNTKFDIHMAYAWGVDFEAQNCTVGDVSHYAGLLDDSRKVFNQKQLCEDFGIDDAKVETVDGISIDGSMMMHYPASIIAERAIGDVRQVWKLWKKMQPQLDAEGLMTVKELEDELTYPTCEMERNAAIIDLSRLEEYIKLCHEEEQRLAWQIYKEVGIKDFKPKSPAHWERLFKTRQLPHPGKTPSGRIKTARAALEVVEDPFVSMGLEILSLRDMRSKYLDKYDNTVSPEGVIRYQLHQMRSDEGGTITGRYSSSAYKNKQTGEVTGINVQQVMHPDRQADKRFVIRELFIPEAGCDFLASDASQIEYRLFAHYAESPELEQAYKDNPKLSFHKHVHAKMSQYNLSYKGQKNFNFAVMYGAGLLKQATMVGLITEAEAEAIRAKYGYKYYYAPELAEARNLARMYEKEMPDGARLIAETQTEAETYGYVETILGRRGRFPSGARIHKALNTKIQGSAADIMKRKTIELHRERKNTGFVMRFIVHDEVCGDSPDRSCSAMVSEILNRQTTECRIPILWDTNTGPNWASC